MTGSMYRPIKGQADGQGEVETHSSLLSDIMMNEFSVYEYSLQQDNWGGKGMSSN